MIDSNTMVDAVLNYDKNKEMREMMENIKSKLEYTADIINLPCMVKLENFNKSIMIDNTEGDLNIWIRVLANGKGTYIAEISSVTLPESERRQGKFTALFNSLKECCTLSEIRVTSVVTKEMENWCLNNGLGKSELIEKSWVWE